MSAFEILNHTFYLTIVLGEVNNFGVGGSFFLLCSYSW